MPGDKKRVHYNTGANSTRKPFYTINSVRGKWNRKDARGSANRFGLHRSLCGFAADRDRRPPFRALSVFREHHPTPLKGVP